MRKTLISFLIAVLAMSLLSLPLEAKKGIGYDNNNSTISLRLWGPADKNAVDLGFGVNYISAKECNPSEASSTIYTINLGLLHKVATVDKLQFSSYLGAVDVIFINKDQVEKRTQNNLSFMLGFVPEYYLNTNLSVETNFGIAYNIFGETKEDTLGIKNGYSTLGFTGYPVSIVGGLAFHFYFPIKTK